METNNNQVSIDEKHGLEGRLFPARILEGIDGEYAFARITNGMEVIVKNSRRGNQCLVRFDHFNRYYQNEGNYFPLAMFVSSRTKGMAGAAHKEGLPSQEYVLTGLWNLNWSCRYKRLNLNTIKGYYDPGTMESVILARKDSTPEYGKFKIFDKYYDKLKKSFKDIFFDETILPDPEEYARIILIEDLSTHFSLIKQAKRKKIRIIQMSWINSMIESLHQRGQNH